MNKNTGIIIGIIALVVIIGGIYVSSNTNNDEIITKERLEQKVVEEKTSMEGKEMTADKEEIVMKAGSYEAYSLDKLILAETGDVVLFFHASWCPSCRSLNSDIENNISLIPEGVSILKVDYDKEVELKKKYAVTYQHTLVQVDKEGTLIKKWSGSPKLNNLISEIQ